jgi:hypothetical protein
MCKVTQKEYKKPNDRVHLYYIILYYSFMFTFELYEFSCKFLACDLYLYKSQARTNERV